MRFNDFSGYKACFALGVTEVGCMAHTPRKFHELWAHHGSAIGEHALKFFVQLYEVEREVAQADTNARRRFDSLGFTFKPRSAGSRAGGVFTTFGPAVSDKALTAIRREVRSWSLSRRGSQSLGQLRAKIVPQVRGWVMYYGAFRPSTLYRALRILDEHLVLWARRKYKRLQKHRHRAWDWLRGLQSREPRLFPHWWSAMRTTG